MSSTTLQAKRSAKRAFRWCLVRGRLDEHRARQVVQRVLRLPRRGNLTLLAHFYRLVKLEQARYAAKIESVASFPRDMQARVRGELNRAYGDGITAAFTQNPGLIGGIRIQVGNDVYDGSVLSRLTALERSFGITAEWKKAREI